MLLRHKHTYRKTTGAAGKSGISKSLKFHMKWNSDGGLIRALRPATIWRPVPPIRSSVTYLRQTRTPGFRIESDFLAF